MNIIETYNINILKENSFTNRKINEAEKEFNKINDILENWDLYLSDYSAKELKEDIKSFEARIIEILNFLQDTDRITYTNKKPVNPVKSLVKKVKNNFEGFNFVAEENGIKVFRKGKGNTVYVSYRGEKPTKYPFAKISEIVK